VKSPRIPPGSWLLAAWLAAVALAAFYVMSTLRVSGDLRLFLPAPRTEEQQLLLEGIGEGPASSVLLVALEGGDPQALADASRALAGALRGRPEFLRVDNGESTLGDLPEPLMNYRYLLSPAMDGEALDVPRLRRELQARVRDLLSPAAPLLEPLMTRDPTLEVLKLAESWAPAAEPE
jgi:predicted exporter